MKRNIPSKSFNAIKWENILKAFNKKTGLQCEYLQFKNLSGQFRSG